MVGKIVYINLGCCSCIRSVSVINNSRYLKAEAKKRIVHPGESSNFLEFVQYKNDHTTIQIYIPHCIVPDVLACPCTLK